MDRPRVQASAPALYHAVAQPTARARRSCCRSGLRRHVGDVVPGRPAAEGILGVALARVEVGLELGHDGDDRGVGGDGAGVVEGLAQLAEQVPADGEQIQARGAAGVERVVERVLEADAAHALDAEVRGGRHVGELRQPLRDTALEQIAQARRVDALALLAREHLRDVRAQRGGVGPQELQEDAAVVGTVAAEVDDLSGIAHDKTPCPKAEKSTQPKQLRGRCTYGSDVSSPVLNKASASLLKTDEKVGNYTPERIPCQGHTKKRCCADIVDRFFRDAYTGTTCFSTPGKTKGGANHTTPKPYPS